MKVAKALGLVLLCFVGYFLVTIGLSYLGCMVFNLVFDFWMFVCVWLLIDTIIALIISAVICVVGG